MFWTIVMEAAPSQGEPLSDDILDEAYHALQAEPAVLGAVAFADTATRTFGMRFDIEADSVADAVCEGLKNFLRAVNSTSRGTVPVCITRTEALLDTEPVPEDVSYALIVT